MDYQESIYATVTGDDSYEKARKAKVKKAAEENEKARAAERWTISVTMKKAYISLTTDSNGLSDPYAEVYVGSDDKWKRIGTTKVQSKTTSPVWNETFEATVSGLYTAVKIKLYDKDLIGSDYIGSWKALSRTDFNLQGENFFHKKHGRRITATCDFEVKWTKLKTPQ
jgi:Ca2+-dependent lipid-binding protein